MAAKYSNEQSQSRSVHLIQGGLIMYRAGNKVITLRRKTSIDELGQVIATVILDEPLYWTTAGDSAMTKEEIEEMKFEVSLALKAEGQGARFLYRDLGIEVDTRQPIRSTKTFRLISRDIAASDDGTSVSLEHRYILEYRANGRSITLRREDSLRGMTFVIHVALIEGLMWEGGAKEVPVTKKEQVEILANIREALKEFGAETHFYSKGTRIAKFSDESAGVVGGIQ